MFDEATSLPMRVAMASLLGSLFGIAVILSTHTAQAQGVERAALAASTIDPVPASRRVGDATRVSLRGDAAPSTGAAGIRGLRIADRGLDPVAGLRWQAAPRRLLRSDVESPRGAEQPGVALQLRF